MLEFLNRNKKKKKEKLVLIRKGVFPILSVTPVANTDYIGLYETIAIIRNENNRIESINIDKFKLAPDVIKLADAFLELEEYEEGIRKGKVIRLQTE